MDDGSRRVNDVRYSWIVRRDVPHDLPLVSGRRLPISRRLCYADSR